MNSKQFKIYCHEAFDDLCRLNDLLKHNFKIGDWQRWEYDLESGTLTFSHEGIPRVLATIQAAGTTSESSQTWMWAWANPSLPANVTDQLSRVRQFGEQEKLENLTEAKFPADEELGWRMAAVATRLLGGKGVYRCPSKNGFLFLVLMDVSFVESGRSKEPKRAESRPEVKCSTHETGFQTFVCEHLLANPAQKWFSDEPSEENQWPDAWCSQCDQVFQEQGEWNGKNEQRMKIKLLCHRCYESARYKGTFPK